MTEEEIIKKAEVFNSGIRSKMNELDKVISKLKNTPLSALNISKHEKKKIITELKVSLHKLQIESETFKAVIVDSEKKLSGLKIDPNNKEKMSEMLNNNKEINASQREKIKDLIK